VTPVSNDSPSISVDDSLWPLLIVEIRGTVPLARFEEYLAQRLSYLQRPERHVTLFDMRHTPMLSSELRQCQTEWLKQHASLLDTQMLGYAMVITSPFLRLMMSTFLKFRPRNAPYIVMPHLNDAARWCLTVLEQAGSSPPTERIKAHFGLE
jgi:hypothetical protein